MKALHASWVVKLYDFLTCERGQKSSKIDRGHEQFTSVVDPFREIDPKESYVSFEKHQQYLSADREYAEFFFAWNRLEEEKRDGTFDYIYCIESVKEGNQDQDVMPLKSLTTRIVKMIFN